MKIFLKTIYIIFGVVFAGLLLMLVGNIFPILGYQTMVVTSGSMAPAIRTGGVVIVHQVDSYKVSDVITFYERGKEELPTTHRIVADQVIGGHVNYTTKGDANQDVDQGRISESQIIGKVVFTVPALGYLLSLAKSWYGFVFLIGIPFVLVVIEEISKIKKSIEKNKADSL